MTLKAGDFVEIEYVGKIKESGEIFDLTDEGLAKEKKIWNPKVRYGPVTVIVGAGWLLKGLDDSLQKVDVGEKKNFVIEPKDGFGEREANFIRLFSLADFRKQGVTPKVGEFITLQNNLRGRVLAVSGGRVRVDFNHPLAGKALEYDVKVNRKIEDKKAQLGAIFEFYTGGKMQELEISFEKDKAIVTILSGRNVLVQTKKRISDEAAKWMGLKEVQFVERFSGAPSGEEKKEGKEAKAEAKAESKKKK